jgi:hypothetical protein
MMQCKECGATVELEGLRDHDGVWIVFCTPQHAANWQASRTEQAIVCQTSGRGPYDRCQWCGTTLKSGYHDDNCPVRPLLDNRNRELMG